MDRFGSTSLNDIDLAVQKSTPANTIKSRNSIWRQFEEFCMERKFELTNNVDEISNILTDWGFNMRKSDGESYKESCVKTIWNVTAKMLQEKCLEQFNLIIDPFNDIMFKKARDARNSNRRQLQFIGNKRKSSSVSLSKSEIEQIINSWDENTPDGLQKKFFHIVAVELAWRGNEGVRCLTDHFTEETENNGELTGRIIYNPIFSKTAQGGSKNLTENKWLAQNKENHDRCPVRLYKKLISKRNSKISSNRLFLTPNLYWKTSNNWNKNTPIGANEFAKWTTHSAQKIGLDTKNRKITNHSHRATAVSHLSKAGVPEQQLIKITGHGSVSSIKPYLHIDTQHHENIINQIRGNAATKPIPATITSSSCATGTASNESGSANVSTISSTGNTSREIIYNNCTFNCTNLYLN